MKNLSTIKMQRRPWPLSIPNDGKRLILITSKEEPQHFIVMEMQAETNWIKKDDQTSLRVKNIVIRRKNLSILTGMHMLRLYGNAVIAI